MRTVNSVQLLGHVGKDPECRTTPGGMVVADFSVATTWRKKVSDGNYEDETEWNNVSALGRTAEIVRDYVKKGSKVYVEGTLRTESWEDRTSGQKRYRTKVLVNEIILLDGKPQSAAPSFDDDELPL